MKRSQWTPEEKMNIVLAGLKGDIPVAEFAVVTISAKRCITVGGTRFFSVDWKDWLGNRQLKKEREQIQAKSGN